MYNIIWHDSRATTIIIQSYHSVEFAHFSALQLLAVLKRRLNGDRTLEDVFRAIKPQRRAGRGLLPTIGRATMLQVVTKVSRIRGIRPRLPARKRVNNGLLSAQFDLTERAKVHRLNSFCLVLPFPGPLLSIYAGARVTFRLLRRTRMRMNGSPYNSE